MSDGAVFHSWSAQDLINPLNVVTGEGASFTDEDGNSYLDFSSQLVFVNLGHKHPRLVEAIKRQADILPTIQPAFKNDARSELAEMIAEAAPGDLNYVFFTNAGAEANEHAVRMARNYTGRFKVMTAYRSYHGATTQTIAMTGEPRRWGNENASNGVIRFHGPYAYRSAFYSENEEQECQRALEHLEQQIILEGADSIAAIVLETVVGAAGILVPPKGYLPGVRALCDKYGIVYIADEVMAGFGRTGTLFAVENFDVVPDLITFAKGVNSGYVPLGGVIISEKIRNIYATKPYTGGLTYSGHPLACAVGVETMKVYKEEKVLEHTRDLAERVIRPRLEAMREKYSIVGDVRGIGMFWAIELVKDKDTREPLVPFAASGDAAAPMNEIAAHCKANGVWPFVSGNRLHIAPPLIISEEDLNRGLDVYEAAIAEMDAKQ